MSLFFLEQHRYVTEGEGKGPSPADYDQARRYLEQAQRQFSPHVVQEKLLVDYTAARYFLDKEPGKALPKFRELKSTAQQANRLRYLFLAYLGCGVSLENLKQYADAEKEYQAAVNLAEKVRDSLDVEAQRTFLDGEPVLGVKYAFAYEGLARVRMQQGNWEGALEASEYAKARAFADKLAKLSAGSSYGVDRKLLSELEEVEKQIRANAKQLETCQGPEGDKSLVPKLESERNGLDERLKSVKRLIKERYPDFYATRFPSPLSIRQANLPPDQLILAYDVTDTGILIFVCKGTQIIHAEFQPIARMALQKKIRLYREPLEGPEDYGELTKLDLAAGRELGSLLLTKDVRRRVEPGCPVIIAPDDCLDVLPFEMLIMEKGGKITLQQGLPLVLDVSFFGNTNSIAYFQSLTAMDLARQRAKAKSTQDKVLVIADVIVPKEEPPPSSTRDVEGSKPTRKYVETLAASTQTSGSGEMRLLSPWTYLDLRDEFKPLPETRSLAKTARELFKTRAVVMEREQATLKKISRKKIAPDWDGLRPDSSSPPMAILGTRFKPEITEALFVAELYAASSGQPPAHVGSHGLGPKGGQRRAPRLSDWPRNIRCRRRNHGDGPRLPVCGR